MARSVGIREVAAAARVSVGTVSNVLNKPDRVSSDTLTKVLAVIDDLGFVRNDLARQLRMGAGTTLGMIVLNVANPFFADLAHACETSAESVGHTITLGSSDQLEAREDRYLELFKEQRLRGMLVAPMDGVTQRMRLLQARGTPIVLFDIHADREFCSVTLDGRAGGELVANHFIETGRRHIAFLGGPLRLVEDRWLGVQRVCAQREGVRLTHVDTPDQTINDGRAAGAAIEAMPAHERPDAVFAANDLLGLGLLQALMRSDRIQVPRDIAIVGYDDIDYAESAAVPLSTVRQPTELLADHAVRLVLDEANNPDHVHEQLKLTPELIVRESSAAP
jgi:LacI family transcriptional regulator